MEVDRELERKGEGGRASEREGDEKCGEIKRGKAFRYGSD